MWQEYEYKLLWTVTTAYYYNYTLFYYNALYVHNAL